MTALRSGGPETMHSNWTDSYALPITSNLKADGSYYDDSRPTLVSLLHECDRA